MTMQEFIASYGIKMSVTQVDARPDNSASQWDSSASHYRCTITADKKGSMRTYFSQGSAHTAPPTLDSVLECLGMDAYTLDFDFADFCSEYGYDEDSRKAKKIFDTCVRLSKSLKRILGNTGFRELMEIARES
jgi:hypothetical protein